MQDLEPLTVLVRPSTNEAESALEQAFSQRRTLIVVGKCSVIYSGRARSKLGSGERIVIMKTDGSLLIHRSTGYQPVNWQPSGCVFSVRRKEQFLEIMALRQKPRESVRMLFEDVQLLSVHELPDSGHFSLYASEEDMQKAILVDPSILEVGFRTISYEKKVEPGFVDVYGVDKSGSLVVVEIKRKMASKEAALQLAKYIDAIRTRATRRVRGVLAAPAIGKDVQRMLVTLGLEYRFLDPKKCADVLRRSENRKLADFLSKSSEKVN